MTARDVIADAVNGALAQAFFDSIEPAKIKPHSMDWAREDAQHYAPIAVDAAIAALAEHGYVVVPRDDLEQVEAALGVARVEPWRTALALVRRWKDPCD